MKPKTSRSLSWSRFRRSVVAIGCSILLLPGEGALLAQGTAPAPAPQPSATPAAAVEPEATKLPPDQLDSLVAPIALYPDPLLAQTLVASTYPLEIIQLQQWMAKNPKLKDKALADAVAKEPWDPAIQSMAAVPEVVKRLSDDIQWTTDLGNAFLEQQNDVMDAVQRMRKVAKEKGALESNEQQKVETKVVEEKTVIVVQPSNPEIIYVPSYSPTVVYGPPIYPYPPIYYPPYPPGAAFVSFGFGVMMGAAIWGGSCCGCGWGHSNNVNINVNNNFNRNTNISGGGNNNWNHNPQHRGAAPYSNKSTANKYGGSAKGQSPSARQQPAGGSRGGAGASAKQQPAGGSRGPSAGQQPAGGSRGGSAGPSTANRGGSGGGDRIGNQSIPKSSPSKASGFGGGSSSGYSGASARASSSRGSSSMGSRGGGSRGGGSRGGGGGRR
jgi:hypothetical protein